MGWRAGTGFITGKKHFQSGAAPLRALERRSSSRSAGRASRAPMSRAPPSWTPAHLEGSEHTCAPAWPSRARLRVRDASQHRRHRRVFPRVNICDHRGGKYFCSVCINGAAAQAADHGMRWNNPVSPHVFAVCPCNKYVNQMRFSHQAHVLVPSTRQYSSI